MNADSILKERAPTFWNLDQNRNVPGHAFGRGLTMAEKPIERAPRLRHPRFGLRTLLIGVAVLTILIGGAVLGRRSVEYRRRAEFWDDLSRLAASSAASASDLAEEGSLKYQQMVETEAPNWQQKFWKRDAADWAEKAKFHREQQVRRNQLRDHYRRLAFTPWKSDSRTSPEFDLDESDDFLPLDDRSPLRLNPFEDLPPRSDPDERGTREAGPETPLPADSSSPPEPT